ncbi:type II secretion system protein M [Psychrosphaera sp. B3R10]|uniref:type II secretion system protein GspM n=1 Tax=unclassified Psychrosphaera TaxID=2641570 RepID=UPI001C08961F|nr:MULTISPECIES: type II secretion system protein M [unclassified Psychrosphaera]MBU2883792.1 type II secretion system protein M [Psychrosphaera sp. I2R16]MBU2990219.1 type II secretion system protein M [Psychrosphaera sp. B3R10]MDO6720447.1 type II secretion system protein M [Psychrosphaera sp. 1_MG-2023]
MSQLSELRNKISAYYQTKNDSEQKLLLALAIFLPLFALYSIISTVNTGLEQSTQKLEKQIELNDWAAEQINIIESAKGGGVAKTSQSSITQLINASARKHGVTISRLQPQKTDTVRVGIEEVGFNKFVTWLTELQNRHGIAVESIDFSRSDVDGRVKIRRLDLGRS